MHPTASVTIATALRGDLRRGICASRRKKVIDQPLLIVLDLRVRALDARGSQRLSICLDSSDRVAGRRPPLRRRGEPEFWIVFRLNPNPLVMDCFNFPNVRIEIVENKVSLGCPNNEYQVVFLCGSYDFGKKERTRGPSPREQIMALGDCIVVASPHWGMHRPVSGSP